MKQTILLISFLIMTAYGSRGQALIYRPINPAFGGNTFNYSWMLSSAQGQDRLKDPSVSTTARTTTTPSALTSFSESLQRQLLSRITNQVINTQFGENALREGTFQFGEFQVEITNATEGIQIRIVDGKGGETTITVPYF
jgi:curli production assembly/transport component CsgF